MPESAGCVKHLFEVANPGCGGEKEILPIVVSDHIE
jgi:hypothetical protein